MKKKIQIACQGADAVPISELLEFQGNLKTLSTAAYVELRAKIEKYGFSEPVSIWKDGNKNYILNGHQRIKTVQQMLEDGYEIDPIPVSYVEAKSKAEAKRKLLALASTYGKVEPQGLYEFMADADIGAEELESEWQHLCEDTEKFLAEYFDEPKGGLTDDDAIPETEENKFGVERGQIWQLGGHRLMCGDSTSKEDVEKLMDGQKADMVFTDPPYGMNLDTDYSKMPRGGSIYRAVEGDDKDFDPALIFELVAADRYCIWGADWFYSRMPEGFSPIVWDKQPHHIEAGPQNHFELCWVRPKEKRRIIRKLWTGFTAKEKGESRVHPTQKPIDLCVDLLERGGNKVVDLFLGSGSTLIACEKTNRKCYGMEIDPHYCSVIIDRWQNFTGNKATRL